MIEARKTEFIRYLLSEGIGREWTGVGRCRHESVIVKECVFTVGVTIDCGRQRDDSKERLCLGARRSITLAMAIEKNLKKEISTE